MMTVRLGLRVTLVGLMLAGGALTASAVPAAAQNAQSVISTEELMRLTALDSVFSQFGPAIATSPQDQGIPMSSEMGTAWTAAARETFDAEAMHQDLARSLDNKFTPEDYAAYKTFFGSEFGTRISDIERTMITMSAGEVDGLIARGTDLAAAAAGSRRAEQIDELLDLVSADINKTILREAIRGMLIGMSVNAQQGDIQVPWDDIDTQLDVIMPAIEAEASVTLQASVFYAYDTLTEAELDTYLAFLRTEPARKFYALATYSVGDIIAKYMEKFGETLTDKLDRVDI